METLLTTENLIALITLASLEIVLGIDNVVFIAILTGRLPANIQNRARRLALLVAMGGRIALLLAISWIMRLTEPLFSVWEHEFSGKDLILGAGGLFLIGKATFEIHHKLEEPGAETGPQAGKAAANIGSIIVQVLLIDLVFSLDSVITAVGMADEIAIMIIAVVLAVLVMMIFAGQVSRFIERHPTLKVLALAFLILIGVMLTAEALGRHIEKGYIYFAMAFSLAVEMVNLKIRTKHKAPAVA